MWEAVLRSVAAEAEGAERRYGTFNSTHEALGVLAEEYDELKDAIRANDREAIHREALQVAAVAFRLALACADQEPEFIRRSCL